MPRLVVSILLFSFWLVPTYIKAAPSHIPEYAIKAALLYQLSKFVHWSKKAFAHNQAPLEICVLGPDPFGTWLDILAGKRSHGRAIHVHRYPKGQTIEVCHIAFIAIKNSGNLCTLLTHLQGRPVLTVSDQQRFSHQGGMIRISRQGNRVSFEINLVAAKHSGLRISPSLLALSTLVKKSTICRE